MKQDNQTQTPGTRLAAARKKAGFTQAQLGNALDVSQQLINFWETKAKTPAAEYLPKIAELLDTTADEILGGQPPVKTGPVSRLQRTFNNLGQMSKRQQDRILDVIDALVQTEK